MGQIGPPAFLMPFLPSKAVLAHQSREAHPTIDVGEGPAAFVIPGTVHVRTQPWSLQ